MQIKLNFNKTLEENAEEYFQKAKKARKKLAGAKKAIEISKQKLAESSEKKEKPKQEPKKPVKRDWFEKFRWFVSSDGFLIIGGRDAGSNEVVVKKHMDAHDLVFHTEMPGSPFVIIKTEGKDVPDMTLNEAAEFCASFSRAWKQGITSSDVYCVKPEQVSKEAPSGEYIAKGSFMIYGERKYYKPVLKVAIGLYKDKVMSGPVSAVKKNCEKYLEIAQGAEKPSSIARIIKKKIGGELDDIIRVLPAGNLRLRKKV
jgi:predicted ribosome quality control (RQC) complex YloA/Tae2 family protein